LSIGNNNQKTVFTFNWRSFVFILIAGIVIYTLVPKLLGVREAIGLLKNINIFWLIAAAILEFLFYFGMAVLLYVILDVINKKLKFWDLLRLSYLANFAMHLLPLAFVGAGIINYYFLRLKGLTSGQTIITIVLRNVFTYMAMAILLVISIIYLPTHAELSRLQAYIVVSLTLFAIGLLFYMFYLYYHKDKFYIKAHQFVGFLNWISEKIRKKSFVSHQKTRKIVDEIYQGFQLLDQKRASIPYAIFGGLLNWLGDIICLGLVFLAFGYEIHIGVLIFGYLISQILAIASFIPGGLGVVEASLGLIIIGFGAPAEITWMSVLVFRLLSFWLPIPIGMYSFYSLSAEAKKEKLALEKSAKQM